MTGQFPSVPSSYPSRSQQNYFGSPRTFEPIQSLPPNNKDQEIYSLHLQLQRKSEELENFKKTIGHQVEELNRQYEKSLSEKEREIFSLNQKITAQAATINLFKQQQIDSAKEDPNRVQLQSILIRDLQAKLTQLNTYLAATQNDNHRLKTENNRYKDKLSKIEKLIKDSYEDDEIIIIDSSYEVNNPLSADRQTSLPSSSLQEKS